MSDRPDFRLPAASEPLRKATRRLRWFRTALGRQLDALTAETGIAFEVDERRLAQVFVRWLRDIEASRPATPGQRRAFFDFAAGLMLRDLLRDMPIRPGPLPPGADRSRPEYFWPEGLACTLFCQNVHAAVIEQEFDADSEVTPAFFEIRTWWSFRENVREDVNTAIGFFDLFSGLEPDWAVPDSFRHRVERVLAAPAARPTLGD